MKENCPSRTALGVARCRAAHQILDDPKVFDDPLALRMLGLGNAPALESMGKRLEEIPLPHAFRAISRRFLFVTGLFLERMPLPQMFQAWSRRFSFIAHLFLEETPLSHAFRAALVARSRYAEDELHAAVRQGVGQYVILGAGLDTFAYRNPYPRDVLHVFEVDHPATQTWKRKRLEEEGTPIPQTLTFAPVDFESQTLEEGLSGAGFDAGRRTFFSWLGVTMYLTNDAIDATLRFVASMPAGSGVVFDYAVSPSLLDSTSRMFFDALAFRVALAGEPFKTSFDPSSLNTRLRAMGFRQIEDIKPEEIDARYFRGRTDMLRPAGELAHIMNAKV